MIKGNFVRNIFEPAGLCATSLAIALGEHTIVIKNCASGKWKMLPRVAKQLVNMGPELQSRGVFPQTFEYWMEMEAPTLKEVHPYLDYVIGQEVDARNTSLGQFLKGYKSFTLPAAYLASGWKESSMQVLAAELLGLGYFPLRQRVGMDQLKVWSWNPRHYVKKPGQPPVHRPKDSQMEMPTHRYEDTVESLQKDPYKYSWNDDKELILNVFRKRVFEFVSLHQSFTFDQICKFLGTAINPEIDSAVCEKAVKIILQVSCAFEEPIETNGLWTAPKFE